MTDNTRPSNAPDPQNEPDAKPLPDYVEVPLETPTYKPQEIEPMPGEQEFPPPPLPSNDPMGPEV